MDTVSDSRYDYATTAAKDRSRPQEQEDYIYSNSNSSVFINSGIVSLPSDGEEVYMHVISDTSSYTACTVNINGTEPIRLLGWSTTVV